MDIPFTKSTSFLGRNGTFQCHGFHVSAFGGQLNIWPITSKNKTGRARVSIPLTDLQRVLEKLAEFGKLEHEEQNAKP